MTLRLLFYVQHLLGVGHFRRAMALARACEAAGIEVILASGGRPVEGIAPAGRLVQLPPAESADSSFAAIVDEAGRPIDDAWRDRRRDALLDLFAQTRPDLLLIEQFPFGRRAFRFELMPLLEAAKTGSRRPVVACSLRDVLVAKSDPRRQAEMIALARDSFDRVLVHGDPAVIPLEASFPAAAALADRITYTGYVLDSAVAASSAATAADGHGEILVSAGGGAVGRPLIEAALAARPLTQWRDRPWRIVTGPGMAERDLSALRASLPTGVVLDRVRPDLPALFARCRLSVSQAGYNTVMELLSARARALVVPFAEASETEQTLRARRLAALELIDVIETDALQPAKFAAAIDRAAARERPVVDLHFDGAAETARILMALGQGMRVSPR
ncbi:glycosyl transferase [Hypericibacter terrae]|uniref:Glycosyl transferase n=1 Tax=Hypericibacter terrae TaxID=2602015 RepID=A0A5J6MRH1_9PROT|nr:glycosyltransferase [Hypericibacter terrae]QEX19929.1 glycosyl transferase [Hypericibacter terrae]